MCGRYRITDMKRAIAWCQQRFVSGVASAAALLDRARFNVAPSQAVPALVATPDGVALAEMRWGFVPFWDKSEKPRLAPINARAEEAFTKPMFRQAVQRRRCLLLADGFYEWKRFSESAKQPFDIRLRDGDTFVFAGIYEEPTETRPPTCLVFTTQPNATMAGIHDRMPVILAPEAARAWLTPGELTAEQFAAFTRPYDATLMIATPVVPLVNNTRNDGPELLTPAGAGEITLERMPPPTARNAPSQQEFDL